MATGVKQIVMGSDGGIFRNHSHGASSLVKPSPSFRFTSARAVELNGVDEYAQMAAVNSKYDIITGNTYTIGTWLRASSLAASFILLSRRIAGATGWSVGTSNTTQGRWTLSISDSVGGLLSSRTPSGTVTVGNLVFMTVTLDGTMTNAGIVFRKDGSGTPLVKSSETNTLGVGLVYAQPLTIGGFSDGSVLFPGNAGLCFMLNTTISDAQHVSLYNSGVPIDPRTVVGNAAVINAWVCATTDAAGSGGIKGMKGDNLSTVNMTSANILTAI